MSETAVTLNLTPREAQFIFENLSNLNVPLGQPNAAEVAVLGRSVIDKISVAGQTLAAQQAQPVTDGETKQITDTEQ